MEPCKDLIQVDQTISLVQKLMLTPHYAKLTETGIFAIVQKARSIGMDVLDALNGGMYVVNGKVELSSQAMNGLIRSKGHTIYKDKSSTPTCCVLVGKRADTGDTMMASFCLADADRAGLRTPVWNKYPEDMLFCRALSRLARQLFPDVIKGCYIQGEIQEDWMTRDTPKREPIVLPPEHISHEQAEILMKVFSETDEEFQKTVSDYLEKQGINRDFSNFPIGMYERLLNSSKNKKKMIVLPMEQKDESDIPLNK